MSLVLSLFSGCGALDEGFREAGYCVVSAGDVAFSSFYDVTRFHALPEMFEGVIGGPPCQSFTPFSALNRSLGREETFGNLIPEFERVVLEAAPVWFLMENVPSAPQPRVHGYRCTGQVLDNHYLGEQQGRVRRFSFGHREARRFHIETPVLVPTDRVSTVTSKSDGHRVDLRGSRMPKYSLEQMLELQGLPKDLLDHSPLTLAGKRKLVGNAVPLAMARAVAQAVLEATR